MLEVGRLANATEDRSHFALWAVSSSPLILGFDVEDDALLDRVWPVITNREVLQVNQAWAGSPGTRIASSPSGEWQAWAKPLGGGRHALLVLSNASTPIDVSVPLVNVSDDFWGATNVSARDLYTSQDLGPLPSSNVSTLGLAAHDSRLLLLALANESKVRVEVRPTGKVLARTSDSFIGVTLDLWRADDPQYGSKWGNASALALALTPRLANLAGALGPGVLRIGGSPQDSLAYQLRGGDCPGAVAPLSTATVTSPSDATSAPDAPDATYYCSQVRPPVYDCLTTSRWEALTTFAATAGLKLVLGLNGCLGRTARDAPLDMEALSAFLSDTAQAQLPVWGLELANELDGTYSGSDGVDPATLGGDVGALARVVERLWPNASSRPVLLGPDIAAFTGSTELPDYFERFLGALPSGMLHALTWHQYPYCSGSDAARGTVLSLSCLAKLDQAAQAFSSLAAAHDIAAWHGEGANCWTGGIKGVTDSCVRPGLDPAAPAIVPLSNATSYPAHPLVRGSSLAPEQSWTASTRATCCKRWPRAAWPP